MRTTMSIKEQPPLLDTTTLMPVRPKLEPKNTFHLGGSRTESSHDHTRKFMLCALK